MAEKGKKETKQGAPSTTSEQKQKHGQRQYQHSQEQTKKDPQEIPILRYGPANNFAKFREALSKAAMKEYGNLGKLIKLGTYYEPKMPDCDLYALGSQNDPDGLNQLAYLEDMKEWRKEKVTMRRDRPKLFALMLQYLRKKSLEAVKWDENWDMIDQTSDPEALWQVIEEKHKVYTISEVEIITKMAARNTYQQMCQGHYESIINYKERFNFTLKSYHEQGNAKISDPDVAMDFFRGLDNVRYATFKTEFLNGLTSGSIKKPKDLNTIFVMANQWLKPKATTSGFASTFSTMLDYVEKPDGKLKEEDGVKIAQGMVR
jgi:hypothetical protein